MSTRLQDLQRRVSRRRSAAMAVPRPPRNGTRAATLSRWPAVRQFSVDDIPLSPANGGGMSVGQDMLDPADIIVSSSPGILSEVIRSATNSEASHASIYLGGGRIIEANGGLDPRSWQVAERSIMEALDDDAYAVAFCYPGLQPAEADAVVRFARSKVGHRYDVGGIIRQARFTLFGPLHCAGLRESDRQACLRRRARVLLAEDNRDAFFCSELVAEAFRAAGRELTDDPSNWMTPGGLLGDANLLVDLQYVGHLKA